MFTFKIIDHNSKYSSCLVSNYGNYTESDMYQGDMIEVFKIVKEIYDKDTSPELKWWPEIVPNQVQEEHTKVIFSCRSNSCVE